MLLKIHIVFGALALISAATALLTAKGKKGHIAAGRIYFASMVLIFVTAVLMSATTGNVFLFLVALFSFYLAFAGWRFARNRSGQALWVDWLAIGIMLASGGAMLLFALHLFNQGDSQYVTLLVFGTVAIGLGFADAKTYRAGTATGNIRISRHLSNMLGGTIAVVTAVLVVNASFSPAWLGWVLPTLTMTPLVVWWNHQVLS